MNITITKANHLEMIIRPGTLLKSWQIPVGAALVNILFYAPGIGVLPTSGTVTYLLKNNSPAGQVIRVGNADASFAAPVSGWPLEVGEAVMFSMVDLYQVMRAIANAAGGLLESSIWRP